MFRFPSPKIPLYYREISAKQISQTRYFISARYYVVNYLGIKLAQPFQRQRKKSPNQFTVIKGSTHENSTDLIKHTSENVLQEQSHAFYHVVYVIKDSLRVFNSGPDNKSDYLDHSGLHTPGAFHRQIRKSLSWRVNCHLNGISLWKNEHQGFCFLSFQDLFRGPCHDFKANSGGHDAYQQAPSIVKQHQIQTQQQGAQFEQLCSRRAAARRITFCLHLNSSSELRSCTVTLPKGKTEHKTQSQPCCSHYSSPTIHEKFPTFNKTIPAEFYCLKLLIKHALKESKCLKSFASTKQLPYYPNCNSDSLSISIHCNSEGTTTKETLSSLQFKNMHACTSHKRLHPRKPSQFS